MALRSRKPVRPLEIPMPFVWLATLASVFIVSLVSLMGIVFIGLNERWLKRAIFFLVSLAVGALFGDAFIHLLPEAYERLGGMRASLLVLGGIFLFFVLEKFLRWQHRHLPDENGGDIHPVGYMNLVADGVHNLLDGMIIAASYMVNLHVGLATTLAVLLHEIPQEIGDYGVLLHAGFSRRRALLLNLASALLAVVGALLVLVFGTRPGGLAAAMAPLSAGGFIYIAGSDLLPELHKESKPLQSLVQFAAMAGGVGLMLLLLMLE
jgi:zinc and cadmium transporter